MQHISRIGTATRCLALVALVFAASCGGDKRADPAPTTSAPAAHGSALDTTAPRTTDQSPAPAAKSAAVDAEEAKPKASALLDYRGAVKEGKRLADAKQYSAAVASFQRALEARPDEPRALSELSWAALQAGDLVLARDSAEGSIKHTKDPKLQAASLYNLGRALEAQGDKDGAEAAYYRSLTLRGNKIVRERLEALGAVPPRDMYAPVLLSGPYSSHTEMCAALGGNERNPCPANGMTMYMEDAVAEAARDGLGPFHEIVFFEAFEGELAVSMAVRTDAGWFAWYELEEVYNRRTAHVSKLEVENDRLLVWWGTAEGRFENEYQSKLAVCGVGGSGKMSCTPTIVLDYAFQGIDGDPKSDEGYTELPKEYSLRLEAKLEDAQRLTIRALDASSRQAAAVGEHVLVFP